MFRHEDLADDHPSLTVISHCSKNGAFFPHRHFVDVRVEESVAHRQSFYGEFPQFTRHVAL
jgi:hypothetical protein